jgi:hypothetical protein
LQMLMMTGKAMISFINEFPEKKGDREGGIP